VKTIELADATSSLADYAKDAERETLIVTRGGKPVLALVPVTGVDLETASVSASPKFMAIIEESRRQYREDGGLSLDEVCRRFGVRPRTKRPKAPARPKHSKSVKAKKVRGSH